MPTDPQRIEVVFLAAAEIRDPAERARFLDGACDGDTALKSRVEALLRAHDQPDSLLDHPAVAAHDPDTGETCMFHHDGGAPADGDEAQLTFLEPSTRPDSLGRIGHYEILQILGQGGFGIVFRAFDEVLQRVVALKVLAPTIAATSPARKRFLREARSSAQVRHENVVQVYEVGEQPLPYIAMEFIPGETLQQRLDRVGPMEALEIVRIGRQIAEGLAAAHATGLIHRDIKPGNILLEGGHQRVKITDFGLARAADDASLTQSGMLAGTPMYMAPEQAKGETLDHRADLFSLGSVLYVMAAGRPPFRASSSFAVLKRVVEDAPRPIRELIPEMPQWLCDIITKLHAKNPDERFQSAREVADVLADCEAQLKENARLKDYSRIPRSKPAVSRQRRSGLPLVVMLLVVFLGLGAIGSVAVAAALWLLTPVNGGGQPKGRPEVTGVVAAAGSDPAPVVAAKHESPPPTFTNGIGMEFVIVPKGKSWLGGGNDKLGDKEVEIPADFYLGKYEVTQQEWEKVMGEHTSFFSRNGGARDRVKDVPDAELKRFPVEDVTWDQCQIFVGKLNNFEKETGWVYRLPTEAEWEYACRGGPMADKLDSAFDFYFAKPTNTLLPQVDANATQYDDKNFKGLNRTCKVGSYAPNVLGLYDMHGNVREWCEDTVKAANGASHRPARGGSYPNPSMDCRAANRMTELPSFYTNALGLRLARVPAGAPSPEAKTPPLAVAPFTDADVQRIAALPAEQQVEEVRKELVRRNPGFDGKMEHKIEDGVVSEFRIVTDQVPDIAPIRVFNTLRVLGCGGTYRNGQLADLTPLKGMNLAGLTKLDLTDTKVTDAEMVYFKECKNLTALTLLRTQVGDAGLVHFQDCKDLTVLRLDATQVSDAGLAHLKGCKALTEVFLGYTKVSDAGLANFKDCKNLTYLFLDHLMRVGDAGLSHLKDCKNLTAVGINNTRVSDAGLAYLKGMPLRFLYMYDTPITDLTPLQNMPLERITLTPKNITRGLDILRDMKGLKTIGIGSNQAWPAAEFWERYDKGEFGVAPFTDADVKRIAALPAAEQVEEVRKELMRRNPGFDGKMEHKIEDGVVTELKIVTDTVTDIAPIRVWSALRVLNCRGTWTDWRNGLLADLTPLKGISLAGLTHVDLGNTKVTDAEMVCFKDCKNLAELALTNTQVTDAGLAHFKDCKNLTVLHLGGSGVSDAGLSHFKDCKALKEVHLQATKLSDAGLANLSGTPLRTLWIDGTRITDLTPLQGMPLENIRLTPKHITKGLDILRHLKSLKTIGIDHKQAWPAAEFWQRYDKGEFKE